MTTKTNISIKLLVIKIIKIYKILKILLNIKEYYIQILLIYQYIYRCIYINTQNKNKINNILIFLQNFTIKN